MLRTLSGLTGTINAATDGTIGSVNDFLFDDRSFAIRWLVVDTGGWLSGRKELVHPSAIGAVDDRHGELRVSLSKERIEAGPSFCPISRSRSSISRIFMAITGGTRCGSALVCPVVRWAARWWARRT